MNREDIIRMAREAGFASGLGSPVYHKLNAFAALVAAASEDRWKQAVIDELVCCHIYNAAHDNDPRKALHDAISWNVQVAIDPQVSSDAQALIDQGAAAEREACAKICADMYLEGDMDTGLAAEAIRARGGA